MPTPPTGQRGTVRNDQVVERSTTIEAEPAVLFELVADLDGWPQLHAPAVHVEQLEQDPTGVRVRQWELVDEQSVRTWQAVWRFDREELRIEFEPERDDLAAPRLVGAWTFQPAGPGSTVVTLSQRLESVAPADATVPPVDGHPHLPADLTADTEAQLASLTDAGNRHAELAELMISFEDPLFAAGSVRDAYVYLYEADKWPERIPHVASLKLVENVPNIQFFEMATATPDGTPHTTRSVRICLPERKIVYKQIQPPRMLEAHTGHWAFSEVPEGVILTARHTATIKRETLSMLGGATTITEGRRYVRRSLGRNSMSNLWLAKEWAEELADG